MINNTKYIIILFLSSFLIQACKTQKLSKEDKEWQPYSKGDVLVFKSNDNKRDSIFIDKIESHSNPNDPLSTGKKKYESLFVSGEISLQNPIKTKIGHIFNRERIDVLQMTLDENQTYIKFVLSKKSDSLKYPTTVLTLNELKKKIGSNSSVEIEAKEYYDLPFDYDLKSFMWSKKYGYTRYEFKDGTYWELEKFIRKGNNILDK